MKSGVRLRDATQDDVSTFFEHQLDPEARRMAAFTSKDSSDKDAFMAPDYRALSFDVMGGENQAVADALMIALSMIVLDELGDSSLELAATEEDQSVQALRLDGQHEPLGKGIGVGCPHRAENGLDALGLEQRLELIRELGVSVHD